MPGARWLILMLLMSLAGMALARELSAEEARTATAVLRDSNGTAVGTARLMRQGNGVIRVTVHTHGITPGEHGIHFHANGACGPTFRAAGPHFNPTRAEHGLHNPRGAHAGDLPNLVVESNNQGTLDTLTERVTLGVGPTALLDTNGSTLVIHANADDHMTDPSGSSGERIACGVIK